MDGLGLGFNDLASRREGLIYCSVSAFGSSGPMKDKPANDMIMQSASGLMGMTGEEDGGPVRIQSPITDFTTALYALSGVLTALLARDQYPEGQHLEVSMLDSCIGLMSNDVPSIVTLGRPMRKVGRRHLFSAPYEAFLCGDGKYLMVGAFTQGFWISLCEVLKMKELVDDPRFISNASRVENRDELARILEGVFAGKTRNEWALLLDEHDVPNSPVYEPHETLMLPQIDHNGILSKISDEKGVTVDVVRYPVRCKHWDTGEEDRFPPIMGSDTRALLKAFGISPERTDQLLSERVVGDETFKKEPRKR